MRSSTVTEEPKGAHETCRAPWLWGCPRWRLQPSRSVCRPKRGRPAWPIHAGGSGELGSRTAPSPQAVLSLSPLSGATTWPGSASSATISPVGFYRTEGSRRQSTRRCHPGRSLPRSRLGGQRNTGRCLGVRPKPSRTSAYGIIEFANLEPRRLMPELDGARTRSRLRAFASGIQTPRHGEPARRRLHLRRVGDFRIELDPVSLYIGT